MTSSDENGFEMVPALLNRARLGAIISALDDPSLRRTRAGIRNALQAPAIRSLAACEELMQLARNAVGKNAFPFRATLFDKSPSSNWLVVWHQDTALPMRERMDVPGWGTMVCERRRVLRSRASSSIGPDRRDSNSFGRLKAGQRSFTSTTWIPQERRSKR
jgi:hypothetical protein